MESAITTIHRGSLTAAYREGFTLARHLHGGAYPTGPGPYCDEQANHLHRNGFEDAIRTEAWT